MLEVISSLLSTFSSLVANESIASGLVVLESGGLDNSDSYY
jgi:hypothetical protein